MFKNGSEVIQVGEDEVNQVSHLAEVVGKLDLENEVSSTSDVIEIEVIRRGVLK